MIGKRPSHFYYGYVIVIAAFLIIMIVLGTFFSFGVFFNSLIEEFSWDRASISAAFSWTFLITGSLGIVMGKLNDRFGPRLIVSIGGICYGVGFILLSQINEIWQLYLVYGILLALGMSSSMVTVTTLPARWFIKRRGLMSGIVVAGSGVGSMLTPPIASWLIANYNWRITYIIIGITALIVIGIAAQFLILNPSKKGLSPYGAGEINLKNNHLLVEDWKLSEAFRTRQFWTLGVMFFCFMYGLQTIQVHIVPNAIDQGMAATSAARIISVIGAASIIGRIFNGMIIDRFGGKRAIIGCFTIVIIAYLLLLFAQTSWMFFLFAAVFGITYGGMMTSLAPITAQFFGITSLSVIFGSLNMFSSLGSFGPVITGRIFDVTGSYHSGFVAILILAIIGLSLIISIKPHSKIN